MSRRVIRGASCAPPAVQAHVHQDHLGPQPLRQPHRLGAVGGLRDHPQARPPVQQRPQPRAHQQLRVGQQDPDPGVRVHRGRAPAGMPCFPTIVMIDFSPPAAP
jgi:hypothetical protein